MSFNPSLERYLRVIYDQPNRRFEVQQSAFRYRNGATFPNDINGIPEEGLEIWEPRMRTPDIFEAVTACIRIMNAENVTLSDFDLGPFVLTNPLVGEIRRALESIRV